MRVCFGLRSSRSASARRCKSTTYRTSSATFYHNRSQSLHQRVAFCVVGTDDLQESFDGVHADARKQSKKMSSAKVVPIDLFRESCFYAGAPESALGSSKGKDVQFQRKETGKERKTVEIAASAPHKPVPSAAANWSKTVAAVSYQAARAMNLHEKTDVQVFGQKANLRQTAAANAFADFCGTSPPLDVPACAMPPPPARPCQANLPPSRQTAAANAFADFCGTSPPPDATACAVPPPPAKPCRANLPPSPSYFAGRQTQARRRKASRGRENRRAFSSQCSESPPLPQTVRTTFRKKSWPPKSFEDPAVLAEVSLPPMPSAQEFLKSQHIPTVEELHQDVLSKLSLPLAEKKQIFAMLCRRWHPDKNHGEETQATKLFQKLQEVKSWFLETSS